MSAHYDILLVVVHCLCAVMHYSIGCTVLQSVQRVYSSMLLGDRFTLSPVQVSSGT
jgi:hypothetical protein